MASSLPWIGREPINDATVVAIWHGTSFSNTSSLSCGWYHGVVDGQKGKAFTVYTYLLALQDILA